MADSPWLYPTGATPGVAKVTVVVRADAVAPATNNVPCSMLTLALNLDDEADAACMFWVRRTATAAQWIDFAYQRAAYLNYPEIYLNTARIRYLGDLPAPTVQYFDATSWGGSRRVSGPPRLVRPRLPGTGECRDIWQLGPACIKRWSPRVLPTEGRLRRRVSRDVPVCNRMWYVPWLHWTVARWVVGEPATHETCNRLLARFPGLRDLHPGNVVAMRGGAVVVDFSARVSAIRQPGHKP